LEPDTRENLAKLSAFIERELPETPHILTYPDGWMSPMDLRVIYNAARNTTGDVLEVGPWLGRSSTGIACGLRDRQIEDGKAPVLYDIIDFGITSPTEWKERFGSEFDMNYSNGIVAAGILHPGGSNSVLVNNLKRLDLLRYTNTIMRGDLITSPIEKKYSMVFCDALHPPEQIDRTMPKLKTLLAPGCTLVADDVVTEELAERVASYIDVEDYFFSRTAKAVKRRKVCVFTVK